MRAARKTGYAEFYTCWMPALQAWLPPPLQRPILSLAASPLLQLPLILLPCQDQRVMKGNLLWKRSHSPLLDPPPPPLLRPRHTSHPQFPFLRTVGSATSLLCQGSRIISWPSAEIWMTSSGVWRSCRSSRGLPLPEMATTLQGEAEEGGPATLGCWQALAPDPEGAHPRPGVREGEHHYHALHLHSRYDKKYLIMLHRPRCLHL